MRLIDADKLKEVIEKEKDADDYICGLCMESTKSIIDEQPTAFDVDNIVSNLEQLKLDGACNNEDCGYCKYFNECWNGDMSEEHAIDMAIEIVKRGGIDES